MTQIPERYRVRSWQEWWAVVNGNSDVIALFSEKSDAEKYARRLNGEAA